MDTNSRLRSSVFVLCRFRNWDYAVLAFSFQPGVACVAHAVSGASSSRILCRRPDQLLWFRTYCARGGRRSAAAKLHCLLLQARAWVVIPSDPSSFGNAFF